MPITYRQHQDTRDGTIYNCVLMPDGKWWAAENLRWAGAGWDYNNDPANSLIYGRLYDRRAASSLVPVGSHLPDDAEFNALASLSGASLRDGVTGWTTLDGTNTTGLSMRGGGIGVLLDSSGPFFSNKSAYGYWACSGGYYAYMQDSSELYVSPTASDDAMSVRFIVDVFNEPHPIKLFGVNFDGFERGMTVTLKRPINVVDSIGGSVKLIPYGPAILDEWQVETELWVKGEWAAQLETAVPPYGVPGEVALRLPPRSGGVSFPGLLPAEAGASADRYDYPQVTRFEGQGRKGPIIDLHGYFLDFTLRCWAGGNATNPATATTTTAPAWLAQKFAARQLQDWSTQDAIYSTAGAATTYARSKHGRRRDINLNLDHLTESQANELVGLYRGVRHNPVTVTLDNGPEGQTELSVYLVGLQLHRTGLHWDGTLETVIA